MWLEVNREFGLPVREIHDTTTDATDRDWLEALVRAALADWPDRQKRFLDCFSKSSLCGIQGCSQPVEVGTHMTIDGNQMLFVPTCKAHNAVGAIDRLGVGAYIKEYQAYGSIRFRRGMGFEKRDGKYFFGERFTFPTLTTQ